MPMQPVRLHIDHANRAPLNSRIRQQMRQPGLPDDEPVIRIKRLRSVDDEATTLLSPSRPLSRFPALGAVLP